VTIEAEPVARRSWRSSTLRALAGLGTISSGLH
jgi:hypothetical protein